VALQPLTTETLIAGGAAPNPTDSLPRRYLKEQQREQPSEVADGLFALESVSRRAVANVNVPPFNAICLIHGMVAPNQRAREVGTGWLMHPRVVITSAHILLDPTAYSGVAGRRARFARLWFGSGEDQLSGDIAQHRIHPNYVSSNYSDDFDIAAILLPEALAIEPLSATSLSNAATQGRPIGMVGHPYGQRPMKSGFSQVSQLDPGLFAYGLDTYPGDSGGPVFLRAGAEPVIALHTSVRAAGATANRLRAALLQPLIPEFI
jgi:V8-like Glu-specific endopeptidase